MHCMNIQNNVFFKIEKLKGENPKWFSFGMEAAAPKAIDDGGVPKKAKGVFL